MLETWRKTGSIIVSGMQRVVAAILARLYKIREGIIAIAAIGVGVALALGLYSPSRDLTIAIAGTSVYLATIMIDPLKGLALWLVTQPLLERYLNISLGSGIPDLSLSRLCMALISVLLLGRTAIRYQRLQPVNKFDVLALLYMVGMMQSGTRGAWGIRSMTRVFDFYWIPVLTYFAVKNLVTSRRSVYLVLYAVLFIALYSAVYAIYETTTGNVLFSSYAGDTYFYADSLRILRGIWGGNMPFGRVFVMTIPILFYFYLKNSSPSRKFFFAICLSLIFVGLYLTYKRTAWIAMTVVMFVIQLFYPQFRRLFIVLLIVVVIASALNWDSVTSSAAYSRARGENASTVEGRTEGWGHALEFWAANPLLGHGFNQYWNLARAAGYRDEGIESEYFSILVSAGLVGFLPFVGLLLLAGYHGLQHYRGQVADSLADRDLIAVFWGILTGYIIFISTSTIQSTLLIPSLFFAVTGAIIYARRSPSSSSEMEVMRSRMPLHWQSNSGSQKY